MPDDDLEETIRNAAAKPSSASQDGRSATARSLDELIKADEHLASKDAMSSAKLPIRLAKLRPGGAE